MKKKLSYKRKAQLFEDALSKQELNSAKLMGLLGTMIYIFGEDVMKAVTAFSEDPTPENKLKIRDQLDLWIVQMNNEGGAGFDTDDPLQELDVMGELNG